MKVVIYMNFSNKNVEQEYLAKVEHIRSLINAPVENKKYLWDMTVDAYAKTMEQVSRVLDDEVLAEDEDSDSKKLRDELKAFLSRCASPEFQIAFVGTIKAGKSTLINALLNYELASTRVTPETAALTKFKHADEDSVEIIFYTTDDWEQLWKSATSTSNSVFIKDYKSLNADDEKSKWLNHEVHKIICADKAALKAEIEKWTSSKSPIHYFVKEVTVGLKDFDMPEGVVFIDTPGLNDVVEFRSNITRNYIKRANAVFMCVKSDSLTGEELKTLYRVFDNTMGKVHKVYVIATQLDTLNQPKKDWEKQQIEWTKYLEEDTCYRTVDLVENNLVPVSAYLYTLLEEYRAGNISENDDRHFDLQAVLPKFRIRSSELNLKFDELEDFTNINFLYGKIQREVVAKYKSELLDDIAKSYERCQAAIRKIVGAKKREQEKIISDSQMDIEAIRQERDKKLAELQKVKEEKRELTEYVKQLKAATSQRVNELVDAIKGAN